MHLTSPVTVGLSLFIGLFGAALAGMWLRTALPNHHLNSETRDSVRLGMGLVSTVAALVLGLLVTSTKDTYESENREVIHMAAKVAYLDRVLESYGPEAHASRVLLRATIDQAVETAWSENEGASARLGPASSVGDELHGAVHNLAPQSENQRSLKLEAAELVSGLGEARWLLSEQADSSVPRPLLFAVVSWLAMIFTSLGMFSPRNHTVTVALFLAALSVAGSMFLILELAQPFTGVIQISRAPLRDALEQISK